jgi:hypothetical protein
MKKKLILHIGRHKTGTTGIQLFMSTQANVLANYGICYPLSGRDISETQSTEDQAAHHGMARALMGGRDAARTYLRDIQPKFFEEISRYSTVVLSSEGFQNVENFDLLSEFFEGFEIEIICYLREYLSYVVSSFIQEVKSTGLVCDLAFFESYFDFYIGRFIDQWNQFADRCNWRLYDREHLIGGDVVVDFASTLGLPVRPRAKVFTANSSFSGNMLGYKLILNTLGLHNLQYLEKMISLSQTIPHFSGHIFVNKSEQERMRLGNECNHILRGMFGDVQEDDFEKGAPILGGESLIEDFNTISRCLSDFPELSAHPLLGSIINGSRDLFFLLAHPALKMITEKHVPRGVGQ